MSNQNVPPAADEIEISTFGPGRGECLVIHLGNNEWCVIDSCVPKRHSQSIALTYLDSLACDAVDGIRMVVATHWHDDHIRGLAGVLRRCSSAKFCCPITVTSDQFAQLVAEEKELAVGTSSRVKEFSEIYDILVARRGSLPEEYVTPVFACAQKRLFHVVPSSKSSNHVEAFALSPSDGAFRDFLRDVSGWHQDSYTERPQNECSVVVWLTVGRLNFLLGADLEVESHAGAGWEAIVNEFSRSAPKAIFYKIPHHGSVNGHFDGVWDTLLAEQPIAVVTPYSSSHLPTDDDIARMLGHTDRLYQTAQSRFKLPKRDSVVEKTIRDIPRTVIDDLRPGHIRVRWKSDTIPATIELFDGATKL
jgi:beta-lactamase superfamily II metal-dependent hydrolase